MAYINLNVYEEIEAKDFIAFVKSYNRTCSLLTNEEFIEYLGSNIVTLVDYYMESRNVDHGDMLWEDGIDELWEECVDYLDD